MAKSKRKTWMCEGSPEDPHPPFQNFGDVCSMCGREKSTSQGNSSNNSQGSSSNNKKTLPIVPAIAAASMILLLGGVWVTSPNIVGLCNQLNNCASWNKELEVASKKVENALQAGKTAKSFTELQDAATKLQDPMKALERFVKVSALQAKAKAELNRANEGLKEFEAKLAKEKGEQDKVVKAEAIATEAKKLAEKAKKNQSLSDGESAIQKISDAIALLQTISEKSLVYTDSVAKQKQYEQQQQQLNQLVASLQPAPLAPQPDGGSEPIYPREPVEPALSAHAGHDSPPPAEPYPTESYTAPAPTYREPAPPVEPIPDNPPAGDQTPLW
ncbi:MAG: hypothetical protein VKJ24_15125 [Synechococcales bacterium]|nr:hypothetical protein [Synechococcales bacterium]